MAGQQDNRTAAIVAFNFHDTDLPLQTGFPLLIRNLITYLLPDPSGGLPADVAAGTAVGIQAGNALQVDKIVVEDPAAKERTYPVTTGNRRVAFAETSEAGVYYVSQYAGDQVVDQQAFTVNLFSRDESKITPSKAPGLPRSQPQSQLAASGDLFRRGVWPVVALLGVLILLIEWFYSQRMAIRRALTERKARRMLRQADHT